MPLQYTLTRDNIIDLNVVKRQPIVVLSLQMLCDVFDMVMDTSRYGAGRSVYGRRTLFLSLV